MRNYNKVILMGNLSQDPEYKEISSTNRVTNFTIAVNRTWTGPEGQEGEEVSFIDCMAYGGLSKTIADHFSKGRPIFVEGRLKQEKWTDKDTGKKQSRVRVVVESFIFVDAKKSSNAKLISAAGNGDDTTIEGDDFATVVG